MSNTSTVLPGAAPAGEYPALPCAVFESWAQGGLLREAGFTADQMRAYADATCAMRAVQPASGLDPELGPMLDFANAGEIAFYDYAVAQHCRATLDILDGKDNGAGACNEPWASVRKRLLSIVELHQSSSASQGDALDAAQPAPVRDYPPLPDFDTVEQHIYGACRRYITQGMLEPIHNLIRETVDADRAARTPADSQPEHVDPVWLTDPTPTPERQFCEWLNSKRGCNVSEVFHEVMQRFASHRQAPAQAAPAAVAGPSEALAPGKQHEDLFPPLPTPDLRDVGTTPKDIQDFLRGYATEYAKAALAAHARAPANSVLEDAARYRWLRQEHERVDPVCHLTWKRNLQRDSSEWVNTAVLDTAIDAARNQGANHD